MLTALAINAALAAIVLVALLAVIVREIRAGAAAPTRSSGRAARVLTLPRRGSADVASVGVTARRAA